MNDTVKLVCKYAILSALLFGPFAGPAASAATVVVGSCKPSSTSFKTIQAAVDAAPAGSTVDVCPGIYPEQVKITKSLTLVGILAGTSDAAVLIPPSGGLVMNATDIGGGAVAAQILVENSSGVTISHLTVDGNGNALGSCGTNLIGIYFKDSAGKITDNVARNQILGPVDEGCQIGLGIDVESDSGAPAVSVSNNSVHNYQKNGITASGLGTGGGPVMAITGNTVIGIGATPVIAQNGIQIGLGSTGKITSNTVADDIYTGGNSAGAGILIYASTGITVSGNSVESTQVGIATVTDPTDGPADNATINTNHIGGTQNFDAIDLCSNGNTVEQNTIYGAQAQSGIHIDDECPGPGSTASGINNTVKNNTINEPCAGLLLGSGTPNTTAPNTFFNVTYTALTGDSCVAAGAAAASKLAGLAEARSAPRPSPFKR
jgi:nitrous oxidase accessory protein NosD